MRGGPRLAGLPSSRHAVNRRLRLPDLRTGEDSPLSTTLRRSHRKICRSQWLSTPRRRRSGRSATSPTRSPPSIVCWPSRLQRPFIDASVASVAFHGTSDGIYDAVVLTSLTRPRPFHRYLFLKGRGAQRAGATTFRAIADVLNAPWHPH